MFLEILSRLATQDGIDEVRQRDPWRGDVIHRKLKGFKHASVCGRLHSSISLLKGYRGPSLFPW